MVIFGKELKKKSLILDFANQLIMAQYSHI